MYALKAKHSGKFLDVQVGAAADGANLQQWVGNGTDSQKFIIAVSFGPSVTLPEGDGTYTIGSTLNRGLFLDEAGQTDAEGVPDVHLWPGDGDVPQRRWDFRRNEDGTYTIYRHDTSKVLDVRGASLTDGANVHIWESTGGDNQCWWIEDCGNGVYALKAKHSGKFLDASDANPYAGSNVGQFHGWAFSATSHQKFAISKSSGPSVTLPEGDGTYTVCSTLDKALFVDGCGEDSNVQLWSGIRDASQRRWDFARNDDGTYTIYCHGTGKVLDVHGSFLDDGANVYLWAEYTGG